jgi:hypothetical protein
MSDDAIALGLLSFPDAVLAEMTRVRDHVLAVYIVCAARAHGDSLSDFAPAIALMRLDLDRAGKALAYQDAPELLRVLASLRGWQPCTRALMRRAKEPGR